MRYTFVAPAEITVEADSKEEAIGLFTESCDLGVYDVDEINYDYMIRVHEPRRYMLLRVGDAHVNEEINNP